MKKEILKIAGVKSEKEFYKKYPTEEAFMAKHGGAFKKAAMGAAMVKKQLTQLTDFANPPQAQVGSYIGGDQPSYKPLNYTELYDQADYATTGMNRKMRMDQSNLAAQQTIAANSGKKGGVLNDLLGNLANAAPMLDKLAKNGKNVSKAQTGTSQNPSPFAQKMQAFNQKIGQGYDKLNQSLEGIGGVPGAIGIGTNLLGGFQQLGQERDQKRQARQAFELSGLTKQVAGLAPDIRQRRYIRPEDMAFGTEEMGQSYGVGTNFLAANGAMIGGNPTEIQNMYNPGDIYSDLGYEPLSDSDVVKQYKKGGFVPRAQFGGPLDKIAGQAGMFTGSLIGGGKGRPNAGGKIGSTVGSVAGNLIVLGLGGIVGGALGGLVGGAFGGKSAKQTERYQTGAEQNLQDAAFMQGVGGIRNQNAAYMEDGGWVSHNWQPQVITQFGEYDMKDLLRPDETMDTLRAGGHLKNYTAPSERAMFTGRPEMAMGGQLKTTWGGYAEPISHNPYLPGSGETVMFRGKSHEESDGNGHTGIGVKYGGGEHDSYTDYAEYGTEQADADVEVERGEPATELPDAETGDVNMVVYGNMPIPSYGAAELGDPKVKGKKFKAYANELSKMEAKQNKLVEKGTKIVDDIDSDNPFDLLKLNSAQAIIEGANMKLKGLAIQKQRLADIQNAILDTAEEMGLESDALAKNKIKPAKEEDMAKFGAKLETAQKGKKKGKSKQIIPYKPYKPTAAELEAEQAQFYKDNPQPLLKALTEQEKALAFLKAMGVAPAADPADSQNLGKLPTAAELAVMEERWRSNLAAQQENEDDNEFGLEDILQQLQPYLIPSNQEPFDYGQITPEMYALASNQLEPVQAQTFQPLLEQPYTISLQDQLNANQADFNAIQRQMGYNPAAASALAAQKYSANSNILGQQLRANQELQMGAFNRNRGVLNETALKNMSILDQQYQRQSGAKSATKAQAQAALSSIADKIAKNKLENRTLGIYENMYNYRFGPRGRAYNVNAPVDWNMSGNPFARTSGGKGQLAPGYDFTYDASGNIIGTRKLPKGDSDDTGRNGTIVKAIKNL
jgi:hypothetical protein